ncbi:MAG: L,D-transpeptidase [Nitrospirota bacterium]|nr:L,D-transpeptidase [Nitrospirota bacterium]MDP3595680.1 L,D-transpeptidase [Nitrospirota bacterium]
MSISVRWSLLKSLITVIVMMVVVLPVSVQADSPHKHRGPCEIHYPSDATVEWDCHVILPGESLETIFGESWNEGARFNRIDRRHAHAGLSIKVPRRIEDLVQFTPLPLFYPPGELDEKFILIDLTEQFLGAYEFGALRFDSPITSGNGRNETPAGEFRLAAAHRQHQSCLYTIEGTDRPYPMNYALRFHVNREGVSYWIHGRDMPGYPASHGCIGLYDETMQQEQYGVPKEPELSDAKRLFEWVLGGEIGDDRVIPLSHGPRVHIIGQAPKSER